MTDELSALDDKTIQFRLKKPLPLLPDALGKTGSNIPVIMTERLAKTDPFTQVIEMVGNGPFRFKPDGRVVGSRLVYERFADYVPRPDGTPFTAGPKMVHFDRVEWNVISTQAPRPARRQWLVRLAHLAKAGGAKHPVVRRSGRGGAETDLRADPADSDGRGAVLSARTAIPANSLHKGADRRAGRLRAVLKCKADLILLEASLRDQLGPGPATRLSSTMMGNIHKREASAGARRSSAAAAR